VTACAFGQASAALVAALGAGRLRAEVIVMRAALTAWLDGEGRGPGLRGAGAGAGRAGGMARAAAVRCAARGAGRRRLNEAERNRAE
jgi:hypothetical protein